MFYDYIWCLKLFKWLYDMWLLKLFMWVSIFIYIYIYIYDFWKNSLDKKQLESIAYVFAYVFFGGVLRFCLRFSYSTFWLLVKGFHFQTASVYEKSMNIQDFLMAAACCCWLSLSLPLLLLATSLALAACYALQKWRKKHSPPTRGISSLREPYVLAYVSMAGSQSHSAGQLGRPASQPTQQPASQPTDSEPAARATQQPASQ